MKERGKNRVVTTEARLKASELTSELDRRLPQYMRAYIYTYRILIDPNFKERFGSIPKVKSHVADTFEILTREVNFMINEIQGKLKALREIKITQRNELQNRIRVLEKRKKDLKRRVERQKQRARDKKLIIRVS